MKHLFNFFIKIIIYFTQRIDRIVAWCRSHIQVEQQEKFDVVLPVGSDTIAIVAIWQKVIDNNFYEALRCLNNRQIPLIVVNNRALADEDKAKVQNLALVYHERQPGLGRDFAAYKCGILAAYDSLLNNKKINQVLFLNDSVLVVSNFIDKFLTKLLSSKGDVVGLTETTAVHYHVSSWCFLVRRSVFSNQKFINYWKGYKPYQSRPYAISKGEVGLTRCYKAIGATINILFSSEVLTNELISRGIDKTMVQNLLPVSILNEILARNQNAPDYSFFWHDLERLANSINQTHFWQLILVNFFEFPFVKKDVYSREVFTVNQLRCGLHVLGDFNVIESFFNALTHRLTDSEQPLVKYFLIKSSVQ